MNAETSTRIQNNLKYLRKLSEQYPTLQSVQTEMIRLQAVLNLPKSTEHFMSDIHGEYEAFRHILNNCSGEIRETVAQLYADTLTEPERNALCTLIYYPEQKLAQITAALPQADAWYTKTLRMLLDICRHFSSKYTRAHVRDALPPDFACLLDELLYADDQANRALYYSKIWENILALNNAQSLIIQLSSLIKRLAVDRLHIVGDLFDRGARPDLIVEEMMNHHNLDIQWGNHDILWMGAACGNSLCIASVIANSARYGHLQVLEEGYGINLRPLALFAERTYTPSAPWMPKLEGADAQTMEQGAKIFKAISLLMFKLEGPMYDRHPEYEMEDRKTLHRINWASGTVSLYGKDWPMADMDLPTVDPQSPYALTAEEQHVVETLVASFKNSERLARHVGYLYEKGSMYTCCNQNLLFHSCIPMNEDGSLTALELCGEKAAGKAMMEMVERIARAAFLHRNDPGAQPLDALDAMWYLWCGKNSPFFGRERMTTFERRFIEDKSSWTEAENPYYTHIDDPACCKRLLAEFDLYSDISHIINGHVPVRAGRGERPVKSGGKRIVIDGGFCRAYHKRTGIAGYTLISHSYGMRLLAHSAFDGTEKSIGENLDIHSSADAFETYPQRLLVLDTDAGWKLSERIYDLSLLRAAYQNAVLPERSSL